MKVIVASLLGRKGAGTARGPPALRIHAGVSRHPCLDQGPHCRPLAPASLSLFAVGIADER
jgi:hypothetical protein